MRISWTRIKCLPPGGNLHPSNSLTGRLSQIRLIWVSLFPHYLLGVSKDQKQLSILNLLIIRKGAKRAAVWILEAKVTREMELSSALCPCISLRPADQGFWLSLDLTWEWIHRSRWASQKFLEKLLSQSCHLSNLVDPGGIATFHWPSWLVCSYGVWLREGRINVLFTTVQFNLV